MKKMVSWKNYKGKPSNDMRYVRSEMYMSVVLNLSEKIASIIVKRYIKCLLQII